MFHDQKNPAAMVLSEKNSNTVDGPAKSEAPVQNGAIHPIICRVSTILLVQDFFHPL
jgi:hypothetical protein